MARFNPNTVPMQFESCQLEQSALINFYEVDLTPFGGNLLRFHSGKNELLQDVIWQGHSFGAYPVQATGFESNSSGASARPSLTFANIDGTITGLTADFNDMVGAKVLRRQVYAKYLDAENFVFGNPFADPSQELLSRYVIEQMESLDDVIATFTLSLPSETEGSLIPKRQITTDVCTWLYRDENCGYTGGPVADELNQPTTDPAKDKCSYGLVGCKLRYGADGVLPHGGFPATSKTQ